MLTAPRFVPTLVLALAVAALAATPAGAAPGRDSDDPAPRAASGGDRTPSKVGDTPSSRGSAPTPSTPPSGSTASGADDRRGDARHRSGGHSGGGSGQGRGGHWRGGHWGGYYGPGYGYYGYGHWAWWGLWGPGYVYYDGPYSRRGSGEAGALDIDISPGRTEVWVDGDFVGTADDFDGFPTFLWLPKGTYDVAFYREGYRTLARQYTVYPGLIIDVEDRMEPGEATRPEDLVSKSTERRDARIQQDREQEAEVEAREQARGDSWRERRRGAYAEDSEDDESGARTGASGTARVRLEIDPADASVYLDGRFIGTADDLARLPSGFALDAGDHELEIVRPGYAPERVTLSLESGAAEDVEVTLEAVR